ncbi:MAG: hypothetical protein KF802_02330 [Bdellovibrionaceae bacterium]|nr:hypothetical protein [Pseudobdellovibrionaceae bacterium]
MKCLKLEVNESVKDVVKNNDDSGGLQVLFTPFLKSEDALFRVKVSKNNAVLGFSKFDTIGIGFEKEKDWNTNLPFHCWTDQIYNHIKHNGRGIPKAKVISAIALIQAAASSYLNEVENELQRKAFYQKKKKRNKKSV